MRPEDCGFFQCGSQAKGMQKKKIWSTNRISRQIGVIYIRPKWQGPGGLEDVHNASPNWILGRDVSKHTPALGGDIYLNTPVGKPLELRSRRATDKTTCLPGPSTTAMLYLDHAPHKNRHSIHVSSIPESRLCQRSRIEICKPQSQTSLRWCGPETIGLDWWFSLTILDHVT